MRRTGQGGPILGFIIGAVLLTFLLIGGVYFMNRQSDVTRPVPSAPVEIPQPEQPTPAPQPERPESTNSAPQTPAQLPSQNTVPHEIPQTGPRETLFSGIVLAILGGAAVAYVRSRRQFSSL